MPPAAVGAPQARGAGPLVAEALVARPGAHGYPGALLVLEGIDGSGRSTHARLLEDFLRYRGRAVTRTSLATSELAGEPIRKAKRDRRAGPVETTLLYGADIAERLEQQIIPALRAGLVVLADRYVYTPMARAEARGHDRQWLRDVFGFAVRPDGVLFLDADAATTIARREARPLDPYEGGFDLHLSPDARQGYRLFQDRLYECFLGYAADFGFARVTATGSIAQVQRRLERAALGILEARAPR